MLRVGMPSPTLCVAGFRLSRGTQSVQEGIPTQSVGTSIYVIRAVVEIGEESPKNRTQEATPLSTRPSLLGTSP